jgi:predicted ATPase
MKTQYLRLSSVRIETLWLEHYKNLRDVRVEFDSTSPYTVLVGENGSGKSNLLEAITHIFRHLDLDQMAPFTYSITYTCRHRRISIDARTGQWPTARVAGLGDAESTLLGRREFMEEDGDRRPKYRPAFVFGYYSGPSDRLNALFEKHRERYYRQIIKKRVDESEAPVRSNALRRLFYAQSQHGQFALLAFFMNAGGDGASDLAFLREHLQIEALESVLFALKRPPWRRSHGGDTRFWNSEGEVRDFLDKLYRAALLPMRAERRIAVDLTKNPTVESLYLFLPDANALAEVYASYHNQYAFFTALESTFISKVLSEVRTRVRISSPGVGAVTYRDLSEGEQQLLLVLGLLRFTAEEETLFLLDEPDTHLNPAWSAQYLYFLDHFIKHHQSCHILMTTHDPLVFARLERSQVRIALRGTDGHVTVMPPDEDPRGMGVEAILTSDLFRLPSALDQPTQRELEEWRRLSDREEPLSPDERARLAELTSKLRQLGITQTMRDPLYREFVRAWSKQAAPDWAERTEFSQEELDERELLAAEIVSELRHRMDQ